MASHLTDDFANDLRIIVGVNPNLSSRKDRVLTPAEPMPQISSRSGSTDGNAVDKGITEVDYLTRKYHSKMLKTTDGLISFPAIKQITAIDNKGERFTLNFAEPKDPPPAPT